MPSLLRPQTYPYASSSTGPYRGLLVRKYPCWDAQGPVRDIFTSEIAGRIKECLEQCLPESNSFIGFSLFMVGKLPEKTKPTIMIVSDDKARRKAAFHMIKAKNILKWYPGFELGHCSVAAEFEDLKQLGLDTGPPESIFESTENDELTQYMDDEDGPGAEILGLLSAEVCAFEYPSSEKATRLYFHTSQHSRSHDMATATCGGIFEQDNKFYVLTTAHAIDPMSRAFTSLNQRETQSDSPSQSDDDFEITGMSDWDEDDDDEDTVTLTAITSPGSKTPSELSDSEESLLKRHDSHRSSETSIRTRVTTATSATYEEYEDGYVADTVDGDEELPQFCQRIGSVICIDRELDIAVVKIEADESKMDTALAYSIPEMWRIYQHAPDDLTNTSIVVKTTHHQEIRGQRSRTPFYTRLPGTKGFLELHSAQLSTSLRPGDSGSWAFNSEGDVIGLVVAGNPSSVSCLLLPFRSALLSIRRLLHRRITAGTRTWDLSRERTLPLYDTPDASRDQSIERLDDNGVNSGSDDPRGSPPLLTPPNPPPAVLHEDDAMTVASSLSPPSIFSQRMDRGTPSTVAQSVSTSWYDNTPYTPQPHDSLPRGNGELESNFVGRGNFLQDHVNKLRKELERAWEIIQDKDELLKQYIVVRNKVGQDIEMPLEVVPRELLMGVRGMEVDMVLGRDYAPSFPSRTLRKYSRQQVQLTHGIIHPENEIVDKLKRMGFGSEIQTDSRLELLRKLENLQDANEALTREITELKKAIKQGIEATMHIDPINGDDRLGKLASDLSQALYGSDDLGPNPSLTKVKKEQKSDEIPLMDIPSYPSQKPAQGPRRSLNIGKRKSVMQSWPPARQSTSYSPRRGIDGVIVEEDEEHDIGDSTAIERDNNDAKGKMKSEDQSRSC
ncbi:hypothetical protein F5Y03DRAFT_343095 [Xylaria venustula]|nr:hypothetical protein F5Y03DRAFT_343095 [Xylaria venustula]